MDHAFPASKVTGYKKIVNSLSLPDDNDRHVLAAAIMGGANLIETNNLKDFPRLELKEHNIEAVSPDEFIQRLIAEDKHAVHEALNDLVDSLKSPHQNKEQVLNTLENCGLKKSVRLLR
jgi:hypothetical protein